MAILGTKTIGGTIVGIPEDLLTVNTDEALFAASPVMRYDQFAVLKTDLEKQPGDTISFTKYGNLPRGGKLTEDGDIPLNTASRSRIYITVDEYGNGVGLTQKLMSLGFIDELETNSILLGRDYAAVTDNMLRDALFSGGQLYLAGGKTALKDLVSTDTLSLDDIDNVVEILSTNDALKYVTANGESYFGFIHPHHAKPLKKALISVKQYTYPEDVYKGEIGEYNGVRFIETTNTPNGANENKDGYLDSLKKGAASGGGTLGVNVYKAVIFGERAYGWAVALPVELREDPGYANFGRKIGLAWYSIMGAGKINDENIVVLATA